MLRRELAKEIDLLVKQFEEIALVEKLDAICDALGPNQGDLKVVEIAISLHADLTTKSQGWSEESDSIFRTFGLRRLLLSEFWADIISRFSAANGKTTSGSYEGYQLVRETIESVRNLMTTAPRIIDMLSLTQSSDSGELANGQSQSETLTTLLSEDQGFSTASRVRILLEGVDELYKSIGQFRHASSQELLVGAIDSGSDKAFDFLGLAGCVRELKEILLAIFEAKKQAEKEKTSKLLDHVSATLPILQELKESVDAGTLDPAEGEVIRRGLVGGMSKLIDCGAIIPEMYEVKDASPKLLMKPEMKLLGNLPSKKSEKKRKRSGKNKSKRS